MIDFLKILEKEIKEQYKNYRIDIRFLTDDVGGKYPAIFIEPGRESSGLNSISTTGNKISFTVYYIDSYTSSKTIAVVKAAEELKEFIVENSEVRKRIINISTNLSTKVEKQGESLMGVFFGIITIDIQLR